MKEISFTEDNVLLHQNAVDWEDALHIVGKLLEKNGFAKPEYTEKIIENIKAYGPYIVITDDFAMPHARPEDGVISQGAALVTLNKPVDFAGKEADVLLAFTAVDNDSHIGLLQDIVEMINDGKIPYIQQADTIQELHKIIG